MNYCPPETALQFALCWLEVNQVSVITVTAIVMAVIMLFQTTRRPWLTLGLLGILLGVVQTLDRVPI